MKKVTLTVLLMSMFFISCSENENVQEAPEKENMTLLKSYKISKDVQGRYSIDYTTIDNVSTNVVRNESTNTNEIHLFSGKSAMNNEYKESLSLTSNELKVGFIEDTQVRKSLVIEDDNIVLAKGEESPDFLTQYSIEDIGGFSYRLNFSVKEGISVSFKYNSELDIYEVHLEEGSSEATNNFSKDYTRTYSGNLKIDFVNHIKTSAKSEEATEETTKRKPRLGIIVT